MRPFFDKMDGKNKCVEARKQQSVYDRPMLRNLVCAGNKCVEKREYAIVLNFASKMDIIVKEVHSL